MSVNQKIIKKKIIFTKSGLILAIGELLGAASYSYGWWSDKEPAK